jgi:hypothetical protein
MIIPFIFDREDTYARDRAGLDKDMGTYVDRAEPVELPSDTGSDLKPQK